MREIEQKFDVADEMALPSFEDLDGVAAVSAPIVHELDATYYDTADGRLGRAGIALRRRHGGADEGWHLKESVGKHERLETHAPLGAVDGEVPEALAALVRSRTRDRQLFPTARIRNSRTARVLLDNEATALAEVADDRVTGTDLGRDHTTSWREVEVELIDGDGELLAAAAEHLIAAGATASAWDSKLGRTLDVAHVEDEPIELGDESTAGDVVMAHLAEQVRTLVRYDPLVRQDAEDAVHKMRVATRRLRSALATFRRMLERTATDPARDELKWLAGILGAARDAEVIHARLGELLEAEPAGERLAPVTERVRSTMEARHAAAHRDVVVTLDGDRYLRLLDDLDAVAGGSALRTDRADRPAGKELAKSVRRSFGRWRDEVAKVKEIDDVGGGDDEQLHEVRKAAKRVRYAGEAVAPIFGGGGGDGGRSSKAKRLAERMETLQESLGAHQDAIVVQRVVVGLADDARAAGEDTWTYGRLHAFEQRRAEDAAAEGRRLIAKAVGRVPGWLR